MKPKHSGLSVACHHNYAALICYFRQTESVRFAEELDNEQRFSRRAMPRKMFGNACDAIRAEQSELGANPELFRPIFYHALGHVDDVGLVLVNRLESVFELTTPVETLQHACPAFCPRLSSLGISTAAPSCFREPHDLFAEFRAAGGTAPKLCSLTRLKLNGWACLDHGSLFQQAVLLAVATTIQRATNELLHSAAACTSCEISEDDIKSLRCLLLDPQGHDDLMCALLCTNYSVAVTAMEAVRQITLGDLLTADSDVGRELAGRLAHRLEREGGIHEKLIQADRNLRHTASSGKSDALRDNHVFASTFTTLGFEPDLLTGDTPDGSAIHGVVEAFVAADVSPGHQVQVEDLFARVIRGLETVKTSTRSQENRRVLIGQFDCLMHPTDCSEASETISDSPGQQLHDCWQPVATASLFKLLAELTCPASTERSIETGLVEISTSLAIPVPRGTKGTRYSWERALGDHHIPHARVLDVLVSHFRSDMLSTSDQNGIAILRPRFDEIRLNQAMREIGLATSLEHSVQCLYHEFLNSLGDPFRYDGVLDLFDAFSALYQLLVTDVRSFVGGGPRDREVRADFQNQKLDKFLAGLRSALNHRVSHITPEHDQTDVIADFRGALNKPIAAADVALKCALGLFRRTFASATSRDNGPELKARVGGVTQLRFNPRTRMNYWIFTANAQPQSNDLPIVLANFKLDLTHLIRLEELAFYFHEVSHLIFDILVSPLLNADDSRVRRLRKGSVNKLRRDRATEVFAELIVHLLVFQGDTALYSRFFIRSFGDQLFQIQDSEPRMRRYAELMLRGFLVIDSINFFAACSARPIEWHVDHPLYVDTPSDTAVETAWIRFWDFLNVNLGNTPPLERADLETHEKMLHDVFARTYPSIQPELCIVWHQALRCYRQCALSGNHGDIDTFIASSQAVDRAVRSAFDDGRSIELHALSEDLGYAVDEIQLVCRMIYEFFAVATGVSSNVQGGGVINDGSNQEDIPATTARLMSCQVSFIKTLWDISGHLRARRLIDMFDEAWPELEGARS